MDSSFDVETLKICTGPLPIAYGRAFELDDRSGYAVPVYIYIWGDLTMSSRLGDVVHRGGIWTIVSGFPELDTMQREFPDQKQAATALYEWWFPREWDK